MAGSKEQWIEFRVDQSASTNNSNNNEQRVKHQTKDWHHDVKTITRQTAHVTCCATVVSLPHPLSHMPPKHNEKSQQTQANMNYLSERFSNAKRNSSWSPLPVGLYPSPNPSPSASPLPGKEARGHASARVARTLTQGACTRKTKRKKCVWFDRPTARLHECNKQRTSDTCTTHNCARIYIIVLSLTNRTTWSAATHTTTATQKHELSLPSCANTSKPTTAAIEPLLNVVYDNKVLRRTWWVSCACESVCVVNNNDKI